MRQRLWPVVFAVSIAFSTPGLAQERFPQSGGGESYGPGANYLVISSGAFVPNGSAMAYTVDSGGYVSASSGGTFFAPVELPSGATVVNVCAFTFDNDDTSNLTVSWEAKEMGDAAAIAKSVVFGSGATSVPGKPAFGNTCVGLASPTLVRKFQDLDGDGNSHYTWYRVSINEGPGLVGFGGAVITWLRSVSPAPGSPTFGDVPTNFLYFRAIEALAASGITSGCGNGNFCPNQNVTRGEMAAFLARALGLHWPL